MRKSIIILMMIMAALWMAGCGPTAGHDDPMTAGTTFVQDFTQQNYDALESDYILTPQMKQALNAAQYQAINDSLTASYGAFQEITEVTEATKDDHVIITSLCMYESMALNINVVFDGDGRIAGFHYTENAAAMRVPQADAVDITFGEDDYPLDGVLTLPEGQGPFPAVIIVHGSGPVDRDGRMYSLTPYLDIAEALKAQGIATLRYDKRTLTHGAKIVNNMDSFTVWEETIDDAGSAYDLLRQHEMIDADRIYMAGHSLGGYLMPRIATLTEDAAGYILLAAPVTPLEDLIYIQSQYIMALDGSLSEQEQAQLNAIGALRDQIKLIDEQADDFMAFNIGRKYWLDLAGYDPAQQALDIQAPLLILQGERDYQVTMDEYAAWKAVLGDGAQFISYPDVNHALVAGSGTPTPQEYQELGDAPVDAALIQDIIDFITGGMS